MCMDNSKQSKSTVSAVNSKRVRFLIIVAVILFIISACFLSQGFDYKDNYYNDDYFSVNAYVGGDAYNYIINGTYFTGYVVISSATALMGTLFTLAAIYISYQEKVLYEQRLYRNTVIHNNVTNNTEPVYDNLPPL